MSFRTIVLAAVGSCALTACNSADPVESDAAIAAQESAAATTDDSAMTVPPGGPPAATGTPVASPETLTLEGLGDLTVGQPVPAGSRFAERGAQVPGAGCKALSNPAFPGVYALIEEGTVRRITVGQRSDVKLIEGVGVGSTEQQVLAAFPGFRSTPHKYASAPAKYLTQPGNDPRLRFEMGENGRVSMVHVGLMPQLAYVEGCG